jgi:flagellar FliL protein
MAPLTAVRPETDEEPPKKKRRAPLVLLIAGPLIIAAAGVAAAYFFVPGISEKAHEMLAHKEAPAQLPAPGPVFADLPEMSVTLPNGGQARQLRIRISLELMQTSPQPLPAAVLSPKVYDALLTYLRTLTDTEVDNSLAIDRIRGDLYRRLTLVLGPNVVRDVLITSLVVA